MSPSLYVHVPFCLARCAYCAFYSGEPLSETAAYPALVLAEAAARADADPQPAAETLYFGGGTPSLLGEEGLARLVEGFSTVYGLAPGAEVTAEVNAGASLSYSRLAAAGVTRVSLGVQSLCDAHLARLGRGHGAAQALDAVRDAVAAGLNVSADLLYGYEGLTAQRLVEDAGRLLDLGVRHLSAYSLETGSGHSPPAPAAAEEETRQWEALARFAASRGLAAYEVSNFAVPGSESRHNTVYWEGGGYLGFGPGAHGFDPARGPFGSRRWNDPGLAQWAACLQEGRTPPGGSEELTRDEALLESLFLALRRNAPFSPWALARRYELSAPLLSSLLGELAASGDLEASSGGCYRPTPGGMRRADGLALWLAGRLEEP